MAYPDNDFAKGQLPPDQYGGTDTPGIFDWKAWTFITGFVYAIATWLLSFFRVAYTNSFTVVQEAVVVGDVIAIDLSQSYTDPTTQTKRPWVQKYSTIVTNAGIPKVTGVVTAPAGAGQVAAYATGGLLPQAVTGLTSMTGGQQVAVDATTSRMRAWTTGDDTLGYTDPNGNVLLTYPGRVV